MTLNVFATQTTALPLSQLDANFAYVSNKVISVLDNMTAAQIADVQAGTLTIDVTAVIQAALTALGAAGGGTLKLPAGSYKTTAALTMIYNYVRVIGDGFATRIVPTANVDVFTIGDGTNPIVGLEFEEFRIWPSAALSGGYAFNCRHVQNSNWRNVYAGSTPDFNANGTRLYEGIYWDRFSKNTWMGGEITGLSQNGVKMRGNSDQTEGAEITLSGQMRINNCGGKGVWLGGGAGGIYLGQTDISVCRYGVYCDDTLAAAGSFKYNRELFISDQCAIDSCNGWGLNIEDNGLAILDASGIWVSGCGIGFPTTEGGIRVAPTVGGQTVSAIYGAARIQSNKYDGMNIGAGIHSISGGFVRSNGLGASGGHGIIVTAAAVAGFNVTGVTIHNNGTGARGYGWENSAAADYTLVENNTFFSNGQGAQNGTIYGNSRIWANNAGATAPYLGYTPTVTSGTGTITTVGVHSGRYLKIDRTVFFELSIAITTNGTGATYISATLPPFTPAADYTIAGRETVGGKQLAGLVASGGTTAVIENYDGTYPASSGCLMILSGFYEATT